VLQLRKARPFC